MADMSDPILKSEKDCVGCLACVAVCPKDAISMHSVGFDGQVPIIDRERCIGCGKCERVCEYQPEQHTLSKKAFAAVNTDPALLNSSASGGVFSAFAKLILSKGGVVVGAAMGFDTDPLSVKHECIEDLEDLPRILGSKYVQSDCSEIYSKVKQILQEGRTVLFGGTSCQVKALYAYLQGTDTRKLYTVDLVCHGVPSSRLLNGYIQYLEAKFHGKIQSLTFRTKKDRKIKYELSAFVKRTADARQRLVTIPLRKSSYYRMFMGSESYQEACYQCPYASIDKPADITAGDYFEIREDYPELLTGHNALNIDLGISSMIVHSRKGNALLCEAKDLLKCVEIDLQKVVHSHSQLQRPSMYTDRVKLLDIYRDQGFSGLDRFYRKQNFLDWKENISIIVGRNNIRRIKRILRRLRCKDGK